MGLCFPVGLDGAMPVRVVGAAAQLLFLSSGSTDSSVCIESESSSISLPTPD